MAKGDQGPDLKDGLAEASRCVSFGSSHLEVILLGAEQVEYLESRN